MKLYHKQYPHSGIPDRTIGDEITSFVMDGMVLLVTQPRAITRIHQTGGNRSGLTGYWSNRSGPVPVWTGTKPAQIQNSKNEKFSKNS